MKKLILSHTQMQTGSLILVNQEHGIKENIPNLITPVWDQSPVLLQKQATVLLNKLMKEINGWKKIAPVSGFRSLDEQQNIWDNSLAEHGIEFTQKFVAIPGHSEHQTGLAIDLGLRMGDMDFICPEFPYTGICQTFREKALDYGFIERYPTGKEHITGIGHEPWHFRYVGMPHANVMAEQDLTLEEYMTFIKQYPYYFHPYVISTKEQEIYISYLPANDVDGTTIMIDDKCPYMISGNNGDGFIITEWRRTCGNKSKIRWA